MSSQSNPSTLLQTALSVVDGYNKWTIDAILAPRAPNCVQEIKPDRLGRPVRNNAEYADYWMKQVLPHFRDFALEILDTIEDQMNHKVALHMRSTAQTAVGPYSNEYMVFMHMTDDDSKVTKVIEFVDSGFSEQFFPKLSGHLAQQRSQN